MEFDVNMKKYVTNDIFVNEIKAFLIITYSVRYSNLFINLYIQKQFRVSRMKVFNAQDVLLRHLHLLENR